MLSLVADATKHGLVAGDFLATMYCMHSFPAQFREPSVRKAIFVGQQFALKRVYLEYGRYWFKPRKPDEPLPDWKPRIDLGTTLAEMYVGLSKLSREPAPLNNMGAVFERFLREALPTLAARTQSDYQKYIERLRPVLREFAPGNVTASDVFEIRGALAADSGNVQANRHTSCLSAVFREAIGWKCGVERNPCHELKRLDEPERTRHVTDGDFDAV